MPKASAQKFHQSNGSQLDNALLALRKDSRVLRHRRAFADCFGANPVASALGDRTRRDPDAAMRTYHVGLKQTLKTGTFYLAGNRNFLFGSDNVHRCHSPCSERSAETSRTLRDQSRVISPESVVPQPCLAPNTATGSRSDSP